MGFAGKSPTDVRGSGRVRISISAVPESGVSPAGKLKGKPAKSSKSLGHAGQDHYRKGLRRHPPALHILAIGVRKLYRKAFMQKAAELLMPAGSLEKLKVAILYGADAVYMGTPDLSLRTRSNLTLEEVLEGVAYARAHGKRAYLTLNLFAHNRDIEKLPEYVDTIRKVGPDGVIVADPGVFHFVKRAAPELKIHISTQANVCSWLSVQFWEAQGADLVVLAREVSFEELKEIRSQCPDIKLEAFVHGAMCMTYSGRCLLSNYMAERGANQGNCANSCRWNYKLKVRLKDGTLERA